MGLFKIRDSQRSKVYRAESNLCAQEYNGLAGDTINDTIRFVEKVASNKKLLEKYPSLADGIIVKMNRCRSTSFAYGTRSITFSRIHFRNKTVILHEMAHIISKRHYGWDISGHGWQFAKTYLDLVRAILGVNAYTNLKESFRSNKVKYNAPRAKRELTEEQRAVLVARMAVARAARKKTKSN